MNETFEGPSAHDESWQAYSSGSSDPNSSYSSSTAGTSPFSLNESDEVFTSGSYSSSPGVTSSQRSLNRTFEGMGSPGSSFDFDRLDLNRTYDAVPAASNSPRTSMNRTFDSPGSPRVSSPQRGMNRTFEGMGSPGALDGSYDFDRLNLNRTYDALPSPARTSSPRPTLNRTLDSVGSPSASSPRPGSMNRSYNAEGSPGVSPGQNSMDSSYNFEGLESPVSSYGSSSRSGQYSSRTESAGSSMDQYSNQSSSSGNRTPTRYSNRMDITRGSLGRYSDRSGADDSFSSNSSWVQLEQDINDMMLQELETIENKSQEEQLVFFKSWFEVTYDKALLYEHFLSTVKNLVLDHTQNVSFREYLPGSLLGLLERCLNNYRKIAEELHQDFLELNKDTKLLSVKEEELCKGHYAKGVDEVIDGYRSRLDSATERATNARQQVASLQTQLSQALARVNELEHAQNVRNSAARLQSMTKSITEAKSPTSPNSPENSYTEELERQLRSKTSLCDSLKDELNSSNNSIQQLWNDLKGERENSAILEANLVSSMEESAHKSQLLSTLSDELINSFEKSLSESLANSSYSSSKEDSREVIEGWKRELQEVIDEKETSINRLDRQLYEIQAKESEMRIKLREKGDAFVRLEMDYELKVSELTECQANMELKENEIVKLYNYNADMDLNIKQLAAELIQKTNRLSFLQNELSKVSGELLSLEKFRIASGGGSSMSSNRMSAHEFKVMSRSITDTGKLFASMESPVLKSFGPIKLRTSSLRQIASFQTSSLPVYLNRRFTKSVIIRHPQRNEALELKVNVVPSHSGEHLKCDVELKDEPGKTNQSSIQNKSLPQSPPNATGVKCASPQPQRSQIPFDYNTRTPIRNMPGSASTPLSCSLGSIGGRVTSRRVLPSPIRPNSPYSERSRLTRSTPTSSRIPYLGHANVTYPNSAPRVPSSPLSQTR